MLRRFCRAFVFSFLSLSSCLVFSQDTALQVTIDSGKLRGSSTDSVVSFKGIPFAAPPVGQLRWRAPQPVSPWSGVREATSFQSDCMQVPFPSDAAPLGTKPDEDCLYLNVWKPSAATTDKLPVMVWIYGGGFVNGGSSPAVYDGSQFARKGVVFVSFNYRLGRFGFFAHPALTRENADGLLGNYGFLDQIAALQWIKKNISTFGGDPGNVTIFGESAGGFSVHMLMGSPLANGLFHKAIIESGGGRANLGGPRFLSTSLPGGPASGESYGVAFAKSVGVEGSDAATLAALRKLPAETIVGSLNMATMNTPTYCGPMVDGRIMLADPQTTYLSGAGAKVPVMVGANSADIGFVFGNTIDALYNPFGPNKAKAEAAYDPENQKDVKVIRFKMGADRFMVEPARFVARVFASRGLPAYEYRFSYVAESMRKQWPGAPHATEIPFVFDTVKARYDKDLAAADEATAQSALSYWVSFAKTGNPGGEGAAAWPRYSADTDQIMDFTSSGPKAVSDPWKDRLDVTAAYVTSTAPSMP
jgi:para-nitrobenzyl esterase